jgi:hypothetical protein
MDDTNINLDETQQLQNKVDRLKTLNLATNIHNLTPPQKREEADESNIAIIKALDSYPRIQEIYLEAQGLFFDPKLKKLVRIAHPYMNKNGAKKLVAELLKIALADWSNFGEEEIPAYLNHFFKLIYPKFTIWHEYYDLEPRDFDYVEVTIQMFLLSSFYKAKGGKLLNVLGKTYSEDLLGRVMNIDKNSQTAKREGFLDKLNPFKKL